MADRVIVLGGGVAGLSAAHELSERGFHVTVLETRDAAGGKARSFPFPGSGTGGRPPPSASTASASSRASTGTCPTRCDGSRVRPAGRSVFDGLVAATEMQIARKGARSRSSPSTCRAPSATSRPHSDSCSTMRRSWAFRLGTPPTSSTGCWCSSRAAGNAAEELENQSWWEFSGAGSRSEVYAKYLADGLTRTLVAARAREMSARTGGYILLQIMFDLANPAGQADRVLNGPTSDVWIDPWVELLREQGVELHLGHQCRRSTAAAGA